MAYKPHRQYEKLRTQALAMKARDAKPGVPHAVVVDIAYPEAVVTVVALGNTRTAVLFSNGGGSAGVDEMTANLGTELGVKAAEFAGSMEQAGDTSLPREGEVKFYVLIGDQIRTGSGGIKELGEDRSRLSPLFHAAFRVITDLKARNMAAEAAAPKKKRP